MKPPPHTVHQGQELTRPEQVYRNFCTVAYLGFGKGGPWRARESITGVWGQSPQQGPEAEPLVGGSGGEPPEAETLCF